MVEPSEEAGGCPASPGKASAALWKANTELRARNEALELELRKVREAAVRRQLTRSAGSSASGSRGSRPPSRQNSSVAGELSRQDSGVAQERLAVLAQWQLQEAQRAGQELRQQLHSLKADRAAKEANALRLAALVEQLSQEAGGRSAEVAALKEELAAAHTQLAAATQAEQGAVAAQQAGEQLAVDVSEGEDGGQAGLEDAGCSSGLTSPADSEGMCAGFEVVPPPHQHADLVPLDSHISHITRVYSVVTPPDDGEEAGPQEEGEAIQERSSLLQQVAELAERLAVAEAELARQLDAKQEAQAELAARQAELAAVCRERDLLQEQAVCLQQEASAYQHSSLLRGGASGAELAAGEALVERSPSRTLGSRLREALLVGGSPRRSPSASPRASSQRGGIGGGSRRASSKPASPAAITIPAVAEDSGEAAGAATRGQAVQPAAEVVATPAVAAAAAAELQQSLAAKQAEVDCLKAQLEEQQAAMARAAQQHEASTALLEARMQAAEEAAESVLQLQEVQVKEVKEVQAAKVKEVQPSSPGMVAGGEGGGADDGHKQCRATIEGIYAQMWRERLARQKAQAEAVELRLQLSEQRAVETSSSSDSVLDEAVMQSLEQEMKRNDHLAEELRRSKEQQARLAKRAEQLELQIAEYTTLLQQADGMGPGVLPRLVGGGGGGSRGGSPVRAAVSVIQLKKLTDEVAGLREQLKAAHADTASVRRRERESAATLREVLAKKRQMEVQHVALLAGLQTVQQLLQSKKDSKGHSHAHGHAHSSASPAASPGKAAARVARDPFSTASAADSAMALLSSLLQGMQAEGGQGACSTANASHASANANANNASANAQAAKVLVSPLGTEDVPGVAAAVAGLPALPALDLVLAPPKDASASEPIDIGALLPADDGEEGGCADNNTLRDVPPASAAAAAADGPVAPGAAASLAGAAHSATAMHSKLAAAVGHRASAGDAGGGGGGIRAVHSSSVRQQQWVAAISGQRAAQQPSSGHSPGRKSPQQQQRGGSGSASKATPPKMLRLSQLVQATCARMSPRATVSIATEVPEGAAGAGAAAAAGSPTKAK